jgi:hypothetical protein
MKYSNLLLLPIVAQGAVMPLESRQLPQIDYSKLDPKMIETFAPMFMPKKKAYKIEQIKPLTPVPGAKRVKIVYGPYRLRAANVRFLVSF